MAELTELMRKRATIKGQLTRINSFITEFTIDKIKQIPARVLKCGELWNEFENVQFKIEKFDEYRAEKQESEWISFEEAYFDCIARLRELEGSESGLVPTSTPQKTLNADIKLPVMEIPTFYGSNTEWCEFQETFNTLVDSNTSLSDIQKFYLKRCLKGNAAEVISNLEVSSENYKEAWGLLKQRFENKKIITIGYLEALFNYEPIIKESYTHLRKFLNEVRKDIRALKTLKVPVEHWDIMLIFILENKLDSYTRREWKRQGSIDKFSTLEEFTGFLEQRCQFLETVNAQTKRVPGGNENKIKTEKVHTTLKSFVASSDDVCWFCKEGKHALYHCRKFIDLPVASKRQEIGKAELCWNCLKKGHRVMKCNSRGCRYCGKRHNSLLHVGPESPRAEESGSSGGTQEVAKVEQSTSGQVNSSFSGHNRKEAGTHEGFSEILLSTAVIRVADQTGLMHECRALLDSGSQSSFMTRELRDKLQLPAKRANISILGIGSGIANITSYVNARVYSKCSDYNFSSSFLVVEKITDNMPSTNICSDILKVPDNIRLADPSYGRTGKIDMLLGVTVFWDLLGEGQIKLGINKPILQNTELGWIISGPVSAVENKKSVQRVQSCNLASGLSVQDQLEKFWAIEEYPRKRLLSQEEEECELMFRDTTQRDENGRFIVQLPIRSGIISRDFYMDDLLSGCGTIEGAKKLKHEMLESGGFVLRKWMSSRKEVLDGAEERGIEYYISNDDGIAKVLGLLWNSRKDSLHFQVSLKSDSVSNKVTKRSILSMISQIFDPLGLVGPVIVKVKLMLQGLWKLDLGWDDEVPSDVLHSWNNFQVQIQKLDLLEIPRQVLCDAPIDVQIHCFCDASQVCYGAAIYMRSTDKEGNHHVNLLCAKSRVAPLKVISLPRLELCGALLLARLAQVVIEALNINYSSITYWCNSSVVLCWLAGEPVQWTTFVGNRVAEIQGLTKESAWKHVRSESNEADIISRGLDWEQLHSCRLWWQGPDWLRKNEGYWPQSNINRVETVPERKTIVQSFVNKVTVDLFGRYSSFCRLQRVVAYILRWLKINKGNRNLELTLDELQNSSNLLVKLAQVEVFESEIKTLQKSKPIAKTSKILSLNPFLDNQGILRVGGRLGKSDLEYDQMHPIILPSKHKLTKLIVMHYHYKLLHTGPQALLAHIRLKYWPIGGRRTIRGFLRNCIVCFRVRPRDLTHLMGDLPRHRVTPSRPFTNVGVDYAGPFDLKISKIKSHTSVKGYLCLFVCFSTHAVHLELVGDLTTDSFLNCFKRFVARRGVCKNVNSDNATNFVGADKELKYLYQFLCDTDNQRAFSEYFSQASITWHFIPPRSPHFGGLWESAVKSAKYHIKRVIGNRRLTFEEFNTVVAQVESCLNSRPLTPITEDPDDLNIITPGHFLIGTSLCALPQEDLKSYNPNKIKRFHLMTQMVQDFWTKWSKEYLSQLQQRSKWRTSKEPIKVGAMVVIKDENLPPLKWQLARVIELHSGSDNTCRVVSVKTAKGVFKRAVTQLCELPFDDSND